MAQTVVGIFDNASEAEQAVERLTNKGFTRDMIDVTNHGVSGSSNVSTHDNEESGISKFFKSLFSSDDDRDKYIHVARRSNSIVTVHAQTADQAEEAADILDDCGAVDVDEKAATYGTTARTNDDTTGVTTRDTSTDEFRDRRDVSTDETTKIPIIEESLEVGKREVLTGGRRLRSRIIEKPVEEVLRLREENVRVERTSVDRAATSEDLDNFKERDIEVIERAEVPVVTKEARVVEEVSLGKEVTERTETVSDTVRKTEVDVENLEKDVDSEREYRNTSSDTNNRY